ncbi:MAG: valine--tRNA ligase [Candidatus Sungbacteria bacterium RIFCSPHIGHO2_02_FULL_49_12]|uniref:Valine--tRNA ligase n=1 Tax=Candidatus Sungbacteria bacterium RIFCSPHIGHO2_02_FULL_49_12 TaxID=1802271 RepID=A0A1G2KPT1_9BACT|nr:MAG: valine--tRNA ligase [Candidatus Sungbacteria bacterium RIFCSPHIGHO2_02_FULL_49_12]
MSAPDKNNQSLNQFSNWAYNPKDVEDAIYKRWEESGFFNPDNLPADRYPLDAKRFSTVMPPPNVTGTLHAGHALFVTLQDIFVRFARMQGKRALWIPGTDHAAIATQAKVEKILHEKEKKTRYDLGRDQFLERVNAFTAESQNTILNQIRKMGASCDWSRLAYTLDDKRNLAVRTAFKQMYDMGLIYRGKRIVNWDPKMQTTVSDDEIEWKEETAPLYYLKYGPFTIATARPETKFGDKYVVVHPEDSRYAKYQHGQKIELEWINGPVIATIIKDPVVDREFGTGAMTITPWHDITDFDIAERHGLDMEQIIDDKGLLLPVAGEFTGTHIKKARPLIVEKLKAKGLVEKIEEKYTHRIATNSRGVGVIEPQIKEQWFVGVNREFAIPHSEIKGIKTGELVTLKQLMRHVVELGQIKIIPEHFAKTYFHWIDNLRDWCISRQIWFGHRIPVWYEKATSDKRQVTGLKMHVGIDTPENDEWEQDPDTLDTWFSSGLWTFSTLGWPASAETATAGKPGPENDLANFHPTSVLETAYEILFFWVARMILMTTCLRGQIPFETVYLHGLVRDEKREKLSKSKGDSANPLDLIEKFGTDALRFALVFNTAPGTDSILSNDKIKGMKNFANKLWNIARFVLSNQTGESLKSRPVAVTDADQKILHELDETTRSVTENLTEYKVHEVAQAIYQFVWHSFADAYIEASKNQLRSENKENTEKILLFCLTEVLKLLHPFMPFITEEIWGKLPLEKKGMLMIEQWPK